MILNFLMAYCMYSMSSNCQKEKRKLSFVKNKVMRVISKF